jgi:DUF2934 family protein
MTRLDVPTALTVGSLGKNTSDGVEHPTPDEIARLAYHFYEHRGRGPDRDLDDWLAAERELTHHYR